MSMVWPLGGCASASAAASRPGRHFRDCVLSATLVIRFSQKSLYRRMASERPGSWGVAFWPLTAAARAPEAARGLRRRRDAFQGWPVPRTLRAAAGGFPYHQVWPPPATFHLPPASRRRRRRPPAAAPSSARCGPPATRFAARTASHTHGASSCPSASLSGGVGRRTGHARDPLAGV